MPAVDNFEVALVYFEPTEVWMELPMYFLWVNHSVTNTPHSKMTIIYQTVLQTHPD